MAKFTTLETHIGDRPYQPYMPGETREVEEAGDVSHLTSGDNPILGAYDKDAEAKFLKAQKAAEKNKAEGAADENKGA